MEKSKGKQGGKRKIREHDGKEKGAYSNKKKKNRSKSSPDLDEIFQEARNKTKLPVCCGKITGLIYKKRYENGEKCVSYKGKWITPRQFEKFGGKGNNKKWKSSIYYKSSNGLQQTNRKHYLNLIISFHHRTGGNLDSPADATEPAVSPVIDEADQTTDEAAAQLNFSDSPADWQKPVASEETEKIGQMQLIKCLENQFNNINNTLKSIDLSLKKLSILMRERNRTVV
uniref:Si:dkey-68o6.5 n=1 Tax=Cyprinus carpio TaxID=7962 RepID=A0A8C1MPN1_CYPCA